MGLPRLLLGGVVLLPAVLQAAAEHQFFNTPALYQQSESFESRMNVNDNDIAPPESTNVGQQRSYRTMRHGKDVARHDEFWDDLKGQSPDNGLLLGLWSYHYTFVAPFADDVTWQNNLLGFNYHSFAAATFINSQGGRSYSVALRRNWWQEQSEGWRFNFGYNIGVIYGYKDGRGLPMSDWSPVIPLAQVFFDATYHRVGIEVSSIPSLLTIGFKIDL